MKVFHFSYDTPCDIIHAEGIPAISRWLSEAIPPDRNAHALTDPDGIVASSCAGTPSGCVLGFVVETGGGAALTSG